MRNTLLTVLFVLILTSVSGFTGYYVLSNVNQVETFNVTKVIDGDTVEIDTGQTIRLLGINAPEENEKYYKEAKEKLSKLIQFKGVRLETGQEDRDVYGRLLRYIFVGGTFVNLEMVKGGYATVFMLDPEDKYYLEFRKAEQEAKESMLVLWNTSGFSACIIIKEFNYTGEEYIKFHNKCNYLIKMDGWKIKDAATHIYTFKQFTLGSNSTFTFFTGFGKNTADDVYWNSKNTVWNNDGDTLFLRDDRGNLVLTYSYP